MGLLRSLVDVDYENGQWCYVNGGNVDCLSGDSLSYFCLCIGTILLFVFLDFYSFCLTFMVVICVFF